MALIVGCSPEFLDTSPKDKLPTQDAFKTLEGAEAAMNGVYATMKHHTYYGRSFYVAFDTGTDDIKLSTSNSNRFVDESRMTKNAELGSAANQFLRSYRVIRFANNIIENAEIIPATAAQKNNILGQAYAIRALVHFDMVRSYAYPYTFSGGLAPGANGAGGHLGVPIILKATIDNAPRSKVADVYAQVESDLKKAEELLINDGRFNKISKDAVKGILSKVYLYKGDYAKAYAKAKEVIDGGVYSLTPNSSYASTWENPKNPDAMFSLVQTDSDNNQTNALGYIYAPGGYGDLLPTNDLMSLYSDTDERKKLFKKQGSNTYTIKFPDKLSSTPVIRLADVYLIAAEAAARGASTAQNAQDLLFKIQHRADQSATKPTSTGNDLLNEILLERRKELAFEGNRMFDLMRYGKGYTRQDNGTQNPLTINYPDCQMIFPIPQNEIDRNDLMEQTACYK